MLLRTLSSVLVCLLSLATALRAEEWTTFPRCELKTDKYGDGDSFHVRSGSRDLIIRLYFVDCAETNDDFPDRVAEQAAYWSVDQARALALGRDAEEFSRRKLAKPFTVITKFVDARGSSQQRRYYGFVYPEGGKVGLAEMLVENGLARVFGMKSRTPEGTDIDLFQRRLLRLENTAKAQRLGGWGGQKRLEPKTNPNNEFFDRARQAAAGKSLPAAPVSSPAPAAAGH